MLGLAQFFPSCSTYMRIPTCFIKFIFSCTCSSVCRVIIAWYKKCGKNLTAIVSWIIRNLKHRCGAWCITHLCSTLITVSVHPWMNLCQFMIHRYIDWCVAKTTNSTIAYFVFAQNLLASSEFSNKQTSLRIQMNSITMQLPS